MGWVGALSGLLLLGLGLWGVRAGASLYEPVLVNQVYFVLALVSGTFLSIWACGQCLRRYLPVRAGFESFGLGLMAWLCALLVTTSLGFMGERMVWFYRGFTLLPLALLFSFPWGKPSLQIPKLSWKTFLHTCAWFVGAAAYWSVFANALTPNLRVPDSTHYHLFSSLFWWRQSSWAFSPNNPDLLMAGLWEYFGFFSLAWTKATPLQNMLFQQLSHALLHGFFLWGIWDLSGRLGWTTGWRALALVLLGYHADFLWVAVYAKNDFAALALFLLSLSFFRDAENSRARIFLGTLAAGLAVGVKFAYGIFIFPVVLCSIPWNRIRDSRDYRLVLGMAAGLLLPLAHLVLRNAWLGGVPFYPLDLVRNNIYWGSALRASLSKVLEAGTEPATNPLIFLKHLIALDPLYSFIFSLPALYWIRSVPLGRWALGAGIGIVIFYLVAHGRKFDSDMIRYGAPGTILFLLIGFGVLVESWRICLKRPELQERLEALPWAIACAALAMAPLYWRSPLELRDLPEPSEFLWRLDPAGPCLRALEQDPTEPTLVLNSQHEYFFPQDSVHFFPGDPAVDPIFQKHGISEDFFQWVDQAGYRRVIVSSEPTQLFWTFRQAFLDFQVKPEIKGWTKQIQTQWCTLLEKAKF